MIMCCNLLNSSRESKVANEKQDTGDQRARGYTRPEYSNWSRGIRGQRGPGRVSEEPLHETWLHQARGQADGSRAKVFPFQKLPVTCKMQNKRKQLLLLVQSTQQRRRMAIRKLERTSRKRSHCQAISHHLPHTTTQPYVTHARKNKR